MNKMRTRVVQLAVLAALSGCTVGPAYHRPGTDAPQAYKELTAAQFKDTDGWKVALPQDAMIRGKWWELFGDPQLNAGIPASGPAGDVQRCLVRAPRLG